MQSKFNSLLLFFVLMTVAAVSSQAQTQKLETDDVMYQKKMNSFLSVLDRYYKADVDKEKVIEDAIKGALKELDPHSNYYSAESLKKANEPLEGSFEGIGVQFNILNDTIFIVASIPGGPSEKLGIMAGDKIVTIEEEVVAGNGITNDDVVSKLRGKKGTEVDVQIKRGNDEGLLDYTIVRDKIPIFSMDAAYMVTPEIGYIKLNRFSRTTTKEFKEGLASLKEQGVQDLILDLRGNGGGYLEEAFKIADEFLSKGKMIVYTEGRAFSRTDRKATSNGGFESGKVVVLVDENSASASEIVSGAIQDWDRGLIIGRRTFGKGLVQRTFNLPDGSAVRLTVSDYFTPSGRWIQKPYDQGREEYRKEVRERFEKGELTDEDKVELPDSLKFKTLRNGREVYGGGGVMPDIFVPLDTTQNSDYYTDIRRKGLMSKFALNHIDQNRTSLLNDYKDIKSFNDKFELSEDLLEEFYAFAAEEGVEKNEEDIKTSFSFITSYIKALIARNLFERGAFYQVMNKEIDAYQKAIEVLTDDTFDKMNIHYKGGDE